MHIRSETHPYIQTNIPHKHIYVYYTVQHIVFPLKQAMIILCSIYWIFMNGLWFSRLSKNSDIDSVSNRATFRSNRWVEVTSISNTVVFEFYIKVKVWYLVQWTRSDSWFMELSLLTLNVENNLDFFCMYEVLCCDILADFPNTVPTTMQRAAL